MELAKRQMPVTFGGELNYRTEKIVFDVTEIPLPYNGIHDRPALAKFMAASHYAYNTLKMPGPLTIITVPSDKKDALICADQLYREAVAATATKALAPAAEALGGKKTGKTSRTHSGKRTSLECCAPVEDVPESSTGKSKKSKATPPETKKVPVKEDGTGGAFTISSALVNKYESVHFAFIRANVDVFAWQASNIPGVPREVIEHHLAVCPHARPVKQKDRKQALERQEFIMEELMKLEAAGLVRGVLHPTWLAIQWWCARQMGSGGCVLITHISIRLVQRTLSGCRALTKLLTPRPGATCCHSSMPTHDTTRSS